MKYFKIIFVMIVLFSPFSVFASVRTCTRTKDALLIPNDVVVDESQYDIILKTPAVDSSEKLYDFAELFTPNQEKLLYKQIDEYIQYSGIEAVIVTTKDLNSFTLQDYTSNFYRYNNFLDDGIIFVIYTGGGKPEVLMNRESGEDGKVFDIYTDSRANQILTIISDELKKSNYYDAMDSGMKALYRFYNLYENGDYRVGKDGTLAKEIPWIEISIFSVSMMAIFILLFLSKIYRNNSLKYVDNLGNRIDESTLLIQKEVENFIGTTVSNKK